MSATTIRLPSELAKHLVNAAKNDPQWKNLSELARDILWNWVKENSSKVGN